MGYDGSRKAVSPELINRLRVNRVLDCVKIYVGSIR